MGCCWSSCETRGSPAGRPSTLSPSAGLLDPLLASQAAWRLFPSVVFSLLFTGGFPSARRLFLRCRDAVAKRVHPASASGGGGCHRVALGAVFWAVAGSVGDGPSGLELFLCAAVAWAMCDLQGCSTSWSQTFWVAQRDGIGASGSDTAGVCWGAGVCLNGEFWWGYDVVSTKRSSPCLAGRALLLRSTETSGSSPLNDGCSSLTPHKLLFVSVSAAQSISELVQFHGPVSWCRVTLFSPKASAQCWSQNYWHGCLHALSLLLSENMKRWLLNSLCLFSKRPFFLFYLLTTLSFPCGNKNGFHFAWIW